MSQRVVERKRGLSLILFLSIRSENVDIISYNKEEMRDFNIEMVWPRYMPRRWAHAGRSGDAHGSARQIIPPRISRSILEKFWACGNTSVAPFVAQLPPWKTKPIGLIGRPKRRRSILAVRAISWGPWTVLLTPPIGSNPKAFAFAHPGRLQKQAARSHDVRDRRETRVGIG